MTAAAVALHVFRPAPSRLLNGKADLSGDMALRIEKAFWGEDGYAHEDAILIRHAQARKARSRSTCGEFTTQPKCTHEVAECVGKRCEWTKNRPLDLVARSRFLERSMSENAKLVKGCSASLDAHAHGIQHTM